MKLLPPASPLSVGHKVDKLNLFYFSDYHGIIPAYRHLMTAHDAFAAKHNNEETFTLSGGDLVSDHDPNKRNLIYKILKQMNLDASAVGNHEWRRHHNFFTEIKNLLTAGCKDLFTNFLSCNTDLTADEDKKARQALKLFDSQIIRKNNHDYGIIGATTPDYRFDFCEFHDMNSIKEDIQNEIKKLKQEKPGLNRFIFLSHLGIVEDQELAQSLKEIDIIIGGHSHTLIEGVNEGYNLFRHPETNDSVLIVQAGNEMSFGELEVAFNDKGQLDLSPENKPVNVTSTIYNFEPSQKVLDLESKMLPPAKPIAYLASDMWPKSPLKEENPIGEMTADALLKKSNAEIALINGGTSRAFLLKGDLTSRDIEYCLPLPDKTVKVNYTGDELYRALAHGVASTKFEKVSPGIFQVAGLRYTIDENKTVTDVYTVDKEGKKKTQLVDKNGQFLPGMKDQTFETATTSYMLSGPAGLESLVKQKEAIIDSYDTQTSLLIDYLENNFKPKGEPGWKQVAVKDNRIKIKVRL